MSDKCPKQRLDPKQRLKRILQGIVDGETYGQIAQACGVDERTIYRDRLTADYRAVFNSLFDRYLQFIKKYENDERLKSLSFKELGMLVRTMIPQRIEAKTSVEGELKIIPKINLEEFEEEDKNKLIEAGRILIKKERSQRQPTGIH